MKKTDEILVAAKATLTPHKFACFELYMKQYQPLCAMTELQTLTTAQFNAWATTCTFLEKEMFKLYPAMDYKPAKRRLLPWGDAQPDGTVHLAGRARIVSRFLGT